MAGEFGEHRNDSVIGDNSEVLFVAGDAGHSGTDARQHCDVVRLEQTHHQLKTADEAAHHLARVLNTRTATRRMFVIGATER